MSVLFFVLQPLKNETNFLPEEMVNSTLYKEPVDPAKWFGIRKDATVLGYSKVYTYTNIAMTEPQDAIEMS